MAKYLDGTGLSKAFELIKSWVTTNFLSDVSYNSTSKKIQKTKNGTTSDVVALATVATSGSYNDLSDLPTNTDTKNTAGSTDSSSKLFLIGATSQAANPQTYSQDTAYVGTDGHLYSNSKQAVNLSDTQALTNKTYNGYTLDAACAKTVGAASGNLQENGSALSASKAVVTDANKKFASSTYSLGSACAKTVGASSGNLQENGAALSASKAVVTDANKKFVSSSYTLGAACEKSIGSVADGDTGLVTGDAVYDAIQDALGNTAGALVYKGTAATSAAISGTSYKKGWYWIASDTFALTSSINVEPGDMIIAKQDKTSTFANDIDVIQTNIDTLTEAEVTALWNAA